MKTKICTGIGWSVIDDDELILINGGTNWFTVGLGIAGAGSAISGAGNLIPIPQVKAVVTLTGLALMGVGGVTAALNSDN